MSGRAATRSTPRRCAGCSPRPSPRSAAATRDGQVAMAEAVAPRRCPTSRHLLVQAGTGTGKSLAYLVPALLHDRASWWPPRRWRCSTSSSSATCPAWSRRSATCPASTPRTRSSRAAPTTPACTASARACPTSRARWSTCRPARWPARCSAAVVGRGGGRGRAAPASATPRPRHTDREWRQVSVTHRDCLGAARCPFGQECFAEVAREQAHRSHLVVTNHSLLAIDADRGRPDDPRLRRGGRSTRPTSWSARSPRPPPTS